MPSDQRPEASRRTLRLTVKVNEDGGYELISVERLHMITPPQPGERPEIGKHGGSWIELRGARGRVLAHRLIDASLLHSTEVHEADRTIHRHFGNPQGIFEVLLPDVDTAREAVLVGTPTRRRAEAKRAVGPSEEIARFDLSPRREGGDQ
ncbi:MAG: hypothetical protein JNN33_06900 [Rhodospirillaceae bacterium]|jgi:hypothetical protein|nr:hypothetical protein [Rhodospirillaceae bacterium]